MRRASGMPSSARTGTPKRGSIASASGGGNGEPSVIRTRAEEMSAPSDGRLGSMARKAGPPVRMPG
jgi:hypothetical protein